MATFRGLLYVKHGEVGTRSEGPDYYLQTRYKEFILQYGKRHHWEPDYHLEFYCRRMVEVTGEVLEPDFTEGVGQMIMGTIQVEEIKEICVPLIPETYIVYKVKLINESSSEISDIHLGMIGVEKSISIDRLAVGASTEYYEFLLRKPEKGEPTPISYGDYVGRYTQLGVVKHIFIPTPRTEITIRIDGESFSVK